MVAELSPRQTSRRVECQQELDAVDIGLPGDIEFTGGRHIADESRCCYDGRTGEITFAANAHAVLPVPIEGCDGAFSFF